MFTIHTSKRRQVRRLVDNAHHGGPVNRNGNDSKVDKSVSLSTLNMQGGLVVAMIQ
jgi:hypothetical protein